MCVCMSISKQICQMSGFAQYSTFHICMCVQVSSFELKNCGIVNMFGPYVYSISRGLFFCMLHVDHHVHFVLSVLTYLGLSHKYWSSKSVPLHKLYRRYFFAHPFQ